ncbi:NADH:ubiquinone oxidoreductase subunit 1 (chain H) [Archaeoglobus sulfaticallidus PM70-1]|uniref:NADH:ubiquinone oxidoreductase subunit 1 (Chain H) n=1 Tax=Archaeoglobus sulfaticallidus PM70-1 TaxID=387631 RepID=N0BDR5_9EURY|nr:NADH-quinone oxidoreductase subunit NuoH [Archaeoglobus sulfaticallidus]AGK61774.1 NADH:ubiquinone oxidoreductase subunit 1 (chain H) [Archaeoglobus sulfaticallidus PM70-1]
MNSALYLLENPLIRGLAGALIVVGMISVSVLILIWAERKIIARLQHRYGPNRAGKFGILQTIADGLKLFLKEDITPAGVDRITYSLAPVLCFALAMIPFIAIPVGRNYIVADLNAGILFILAVASLSVIPVMMAGWSANNKYNLLGGLRGAALMISYEIPAGLAIIGILVQSGSLRLADIVEAQRDGWFILPQFLGFAAFLISAFMESARPPFDLLEAESEIVQGWTTEYGGVKFALLMFGEYTHSVLSAMLIAILYLGGWLGPFDSSLWLIIKALLVMIFLMWVRASVARIRIDQMLNFGWKVLIPIALLNIVIAGIVRLHYY